MDKKQIADAFDLHGTDKGRRRHNYQNAYESILSKFQPNSMLEVGVHEGRSLAAWKELFPSAIINGIEVRNTPLIEAAQSIPVFRGNATNKEFIDSVVTQSYDIIIDDGDHRPDVQWKVFLNMQNKWSKYYVFEDVCLSENEKVIRKRLNENGYRNVTTWTSSFNAPGTDLRGRVQVKGEQLYPPFYLMIVTKE